MFFPPSEILIILQPVKIKGQPESGILKTGTTRENTDETERNKVSSSLGGRKTWSITMWLSLLYHSFCILRSTL